MGLRCRQARAVVMVEQVAHALLDLLQRSPRMLTASTSEGSLHFQNRIAAVAQELMRVTSAMASAVTQLNQVGAQ